MTSYLRYKQQIRTAQDADDDIESWITVRGNHIPIKKGQSKEEAVKSFIESKGSEYKKESYGKYYVKYGEGENKRYASPRNDLIYSDKSRAGFFGSEKEAKEYAKKLNHTDPYAGTPFAMKNYKRTVLPYEVESEEKESKYDPEFEVVRKNALTNGSVYGGKYTQKSKAEAYKEYKNDTSSKENMKKANEFVNGKPESSKKWSGWGMNKNKQVFSIKGGRVVVDPKLKTANWYNSQGALTLKQKDLDVDKFVEHGINNLGWQKMSEKEESVLKEFQKIANKPEYKDKEIESGFEMLPKDYTIAHKDKDGKTTVIAEVSHKNISTSANNPVAKTSPKEWKERGNKPVSLGEATKKATQISYSLNQKAKKEANYTALEIAYNDVSFTKSPKQNKADLLKAVSKSGAEHSEYMTQTINNMPETAFESINSFRNGLKDSSKWSSSWSKRANKPQALGTALKNTMNIVSEQRTIGKINKKADK